MNAVDVVFSASLALSVLFPDAKCKPSFTQRPPRKQFIIQGNDAFFDWNYNNDSYSLLFGKWGKKNAALQFYISETAAGLTNSDATKYQLIKPAKLRLINTTISSTGRYYCQLNFLKTQPSDSSVLEDEADLTVVRSAPSFTSSLPEKKVSTEGSSEIKLTVIVKGDQKPIVSWYRNGVLASGSFPVTTNTIGKSQQNETIVQSNLTINLPNRTSNSVFLAKATYGDFSPMSNTSTVIDVWYGPENEKFSSSKSGLSIGKNEMVVIQCTANSNPAPKFTIYRNQTILLNNSASGVYTINAFGRNDSGNYSCLIQNEVSSKRLDGVWFLYNETKIVYTTVSTTTLNSSSTKVAPTKGGKITAPGSNALPWWVWLTIALAIVFLLCIPVAVIFFHKRKNLKRRKTKRFSSHGDYLDNYINNTQFSLGYENQIEKEPEPRSPFVLEEREIATEAERDHELARDNLGVKFESEADLIDHYKKGPEKKEGDDDYDDDVKDYDPFESDDDDNLDSVTKEDFGDEHGIHYETDDTINENNENDIEDGNEAEPYIDLENEIITYNI